MRQNGVLQAVVPRLATFSWAWAAATALLLATVGTLVLDIALWGGQRFRPPPVSFIQGQAIYFVEMLMALAYGAMGWLLATRLSRNPLGWLFMLVGLAMALQMSTTFWVQQGHQAFRPMEPLALLAAWAGSTLHLPLTIVLLVFVFLLFPDGRALSRRWAWAGWAAVAGAGLVGLSVGLAPEGLQWFPTLSNPLAAPSVLRPVLPVLNVGGLVLLVGGAVGATGSLVVRYRRAAAVERAQLRWIAAAVLLLTGAGVPFVIARYGLQMDYASGELMLAIALAAGSFLPVAAAVAVLRHRLYDIDLILNRALVYIPLTGILGGFYTAGVAVSQRVFVAITGDRSDAAIIVTTLVMASLFTPIRNWLQSFVDRRFKPSPAALAAERQASHSPLDELSERVALLESRLEQLGQTRGG
jgi:hypothetical protein